MHHVEKLYYKKKIDFMEFLLVITEMIPMVFLISLKVVKLHKRDHKVKKLI